jgi:predicted 3-demethylubiquinone-9 3-methyltransferase (glyoxalase superfamily)
MLTIRGGMWVGAVIASSVPLLVVQHCIQPLAGHTTRIDFNFAFSFIVSISVIANIGQIINALSRRGTIKRLRARVERLQADLGIEEAIP